MFKKTIKLWTVAFFLYGSLFLFNIKLFTENAPLVLVSMVKVIYMSNFMQEKKFKKKLMWIMSCNKAIIVIVGQKKTDSLPQVVSCLSWR